MFRQLNQTIIALVPKFEHSPSVVDYRLISCYNVIYKVITKIIADRLSPALEHLIDSSKATFVRGGNITDNIFLTQEIVRLYLRKGISPRCTINIDLLALNDSLHGFFSGKKGLKQGDPMSPALFLLCMEFFSRLIKRNTSNSNFNFPPKMRKFFIRRKKADWVSDTFNPGMLLSLPESYETFIARQTCYGLNVSMSGSAYGGVVQHLDYGNDWQHGTDLPSYRRIHRARCALTVMNRPNISSSNASSVIMFGRIFDSDLASPDACEPFSVRSSGSRKGKWTPLCRIKCGILLWHARSQPLEAPKRNCL
ncbi:hypothetical protein Sango_0820200 [Sesamum angolense]|uniref:Reverse transcriptase domain-containing protein n=1 Tax=Sesamum angolense TaxID=2727404 RepID=A0AAE1X3M9_9LAMI|nr:hypothetical protein Sango_0820200 [Sesamum angolense]